MSEGQARIGLLQANNLIMSSTITWEELAPIMENRCNDAIVSRRIQFLKDLLNLVEGETLETPQLAQISMNLLKTFVIYQDTKSKDLVISIFHAILPLEPRLLEKYITFILEQVSKYPGTRALSDYLNLFDWIHSFLEVIATDSSRFEELIPKLLEVHCYTTYGIETVLDNQETTKKTHFRRNQHRKRIRESVLQATSKTFTHCFKHNGNASSYFSAICKIVLEDHTKLKLPVTGVVVIMGALTQSSIQLAPSQPALLHELKEKYAEKYIEFIGKEIIIGKNPPSTFCLEISLNPFLKEFLTEESFKSQLLPNLEKANLRSPESAFAIAAELYAGVNAKNINLLNIFTSSKLMTQSFSSFKSSKEAVRDISLHSVITLFESIDIENVDESDLLKYVDEIFKNIKSNLNADYKSLVSKILFAIPSSFEQVSAKIAQDLSIYVTKEGNENALNIMLLAFFSHYLTLSQPSADINKLIKNGFKEKKPSLKKCWFTSLLEMSAKSTKEMLESFEAECLEFISETLSHHFKHDHKNILACLIYFDAAYTLGITDLQEKLHTVISSLPKTSIIGAAFVNVALSRTLVSSDRLEGVKLLYTAFAREPELIGLSVVEALEEKLQQSQQLMDGSISYKYIAPVFGAISQPIENNELSIRVLIQELIVSQFSGFNLKNGWAGLVLGAGKDPATITAENTKDIIDKIISISDDTSLLKSPLHVCALKAAAYASFINPNAFAPEIATIIKNDLAVGKIPDLTEEDFEILAGEEGTMVINVLEKKMDNKLTDKNTKDYETLKWEQSIRKEQSKKTNKKLTKEEQELVNKQLSTESEIRLKLAYKIYSTYISFG